MTDGIAVRALVSAVVAVLLGGCGGAAATDPATGPAADSTAAAPTVTADPAGRAGTLRVGQQGDTPERTVWYVRIETPRAEPLAEQGFPAAPIQLVRRLAPGQYRVISWWRACRGPCPGEGEQGLGPLEDVCGALVTVVAGRSVTATVETGEQGCEVTVG